MLREVEGVRVEDFPQGTGSLSAIPGEVSRLRRYGVDVGFDLETTDTDLINSKIVTLAFKPKGKRAAVLDVRHLNEKELRSLGSMLEPLFDGQVALVGHNLKFDMEFMFAQLGLAGHRVYDTMLSDQLILGLGVSSAAEKGIHFDMLSVAGRYGLAVHKEERSWFIHLDERVEGQVKSQVGSHIECTEPYEDCGEWIDSACIEVPEYAMVGGHRPWDEPLPPEQLRYIRQDVSVVHKIKEAQIALIERDGLGEVSQLEDRVVFPLAGIETWGVQINREGWLSVIDRVSDRARELEVVLHLGSEGLRRLRETFIHFQHETWQRMSGDSTWEEFSAESSAKWEERHKDLLGLGEFEGLDVHVLKVRQDRYMDKWLPYQEWMKARDAFVATRKRDWEQLPAEARAALGFKNWAEYKKATLEHWYIDHGKNGKPPSNKAGVNLGSWMQVRDGFNDLGLPVSSVSEEELERHRDFHPLVGVYLEYAKARKIVTVYGRERGKKGKSFIEMLDSSDRLRASYQQIGADTGRMSSHSPNFQQIPVDGIGAELRRHVIAAPGYTLVVADFSNIELRIVAELSGDKFLLDAFKSGQDIHAYTAQVMFDLDIPAGEDLKKWTNSHDAVIGGRTLTDTPYRKISKTINYMLLYGAGVRKLASMLNVEERDAKELLKTYYQTFSQAIGWLNAQKERLAEAKKRHESKVFAQTLSGRRRYFDIPHYPKHPANGSRVTVEAQLKWEEEVEEWRKKNASIKRQLANTPVQGLSADITKEAAAQWYEVVGYAQDMRLVAVIHDEFIVECMLDRVHEARTVLREVMCRAMEKYLHVVDLGEIDPVETPYWSH